MSYTTTSAIHPMALQTATIMEMERQLLSYYESPFWGEFPQPMPRLMLRSMIFVLYRIVRVHLVSLLSRLTEKNALINVASLFGIVFTQGYTYVTTNVDRLPLVIFVLGLMYVALFLPLSPLLRIPITGIMYRITELVSICLQWSWMHSYLMVNYGRPMTILSIITYGFAFLLHFLSRQRIMQFW
jgi:hypothetical protein